MARFLQTPEAQLVLWGALFAALLAVGFYVVARVRRSIREDADVPTANEMMSKFRDLYSQGDLSDEEYRTIKSTLAGKFQKEIGGGNSQKNEPGGNPYSSP